MIDFQKLKKLRKETDVSFSLCKKALEEAKDDLEKAKKLLQQWGANELKSKAEKVAKEGAIFSYVHHNGKVASLVELFCETDFVAANSQFKELGKNIAMQIASLNPQSLAELLDQDYIKDPTKKIADLINEAVLKFGEKIQVGQFIRWAI
jgi:elongation factor Ts